MIEKGAAAWNGWRQDHPDIRPDISFSHIRRTDLAGVDLSGSDMRRAMLPGVCLRGADLDHADLSGIDLMEADLEGASLRGADLTGANLMGANLKKADLEGVILENAILYRADLGGTECARNALWLQTLMNFAEGLAQIEGDAGGFEFDGIESSHIHSSFVSTDICRLEIRLADPISAGASVEIMGALNRLYSKVADIDLPGPIVQIGHPE